MLQLQTKQIAALNAICEALIPSIKKVDDADGFWARSASDLDIPNRIIEVVGQLSDRDQKEMQQVLSLLSNPLVGLTWWGPFKGVQNLSIDQRERLLQKWSASPLADLRKAFNSLKKLTGLLYFGGSPDGHNPNWKSLQYHPLTQKPDRPHPDLHPLAFPASGELTADVIVIGSGAGGGVAAAVLAASGKKVIVIEKGSYLRHRDFTQQEVEMMQQLYEAKGLLTSVDGGLTVLAGSCLGGGTTVNWAGAFRTPDYVLEEWAKEHHNPQFLDPEYQKGFDFVEKRNAVTTDLLRHNPQNQALFSGAEQLGYKVSVIPRNMKAPEGLTPESFWQAQGFSPLGDANGSKLGSVETFLQDAVADGAKILVDTEVEKVIIKNGKAVGVMATQWVDGQKRSLHLHAEKVIVAAGAIHSPALLRRSGLKHSAIGRHLYLHPTVAVSARYRETVAPWYGPMMSAVCDQFTRLDGNFGCKLETPPVHPGLMAAALSWQSGAQFKEEMLQVARTGTFIVLTRDKHGGQVRLDKKGQPQIHYRLSDYDRGHLIRGMQEASRIHRAAGAERISILHNQAIHFPDDQSDFEAFLQAIPQKKWSLNHYGLFSAHQMGTCRMGGSDSQHPVKPNGETREVKNLYVADSSAFPSASGANPMLSIQVLAYYVAKGMV